MNKTSIGWTDLSSNPIRYRDAAGKTVHACERISPACAHCYAADLAKRYGRGGGAFTEAERKTYTPYFDEAEARKILTAKTVGGKPVSGSRCFIGDMSDYFGEWVPDELLDKLFAVMALRSDVTFQVLTKRPERARAYMAGRDWTDATNAVVDRCVRRLEGPLYLAGEVTPPLHNVWLGTSVENQHWADKRIPELLQTPAAVRFLSIEPLLGPLNLEKLTTPYYESPGGVGREVYPLAGLFAIPDCDWDVPKLDWGILGGESGANLRDPGLPAFLNVAEQFQRAGVPLYVKQDVHRRPGQQGRFPADLWALKQFPDASGKDRS